MKTYIPIHVEVDNEDSDDGFFSIGFVFNYDPTQAPHNLGLCRDASENPDNIYFEPDDQIHGFNTQKARFSIDGSILELELLDQNVFYWDSSKIIRIAIPDDQIDDVKQCLISIFSLKI